MTRAWMGEGRPAVLLAMLGWLMSAESTAAADQAERVLLVAPPPRLGPAVRAALSAWPIIVVVTANAGMDGTVPTPGHTRPDSADRARTLAAAHHAGAVVWLSEDGAGGQELRVYDAASRRTSTRRLVDPPPFDEPTAAAVALSVKTLLRHSSVVPARERYGAAAAGAEIASRAPRLLVDTHVSNRIRPTGPGYELRLGVGIRAAPGAIARFGAAALSVEGGPGVPVEAEDFSGEFSDLQVGAALAARIPLGRRFPRLEVWPQLGGSLHFTQIEGAVTSQAARARAGRVNPSADAGLALEVSLPRWPWLRLSASTTASYNLRQQIYLVGGEPVLSIRGFAIDLGVALSVLLL